MIINIAAALLLAVLIAIPTVAVIRVYRDELADRFRPLARWLAFDPRHPALSYVSPSPRRARES